MNKYITEGSTTYLIVEHKDGRQSLILIDTEDLDKVSHYTWGAYKGRNGKVYAKHSVSGTYLHRVIIPDIPEGHVIDHIDHDGLNNTKSNLRVVTHQYNVTRRKGSNSNTGIRGVSYYSKTDNYKANIKVKGKKIHLGYFHDQYEAGREVNKALMHYFGSEFAMRTPIKILAED